MAATIRSLQDTSGNQVFPVTRSTATYMSDNSTVEDSVNSKVDTGVIITDADTLLAITEPGYIADATLIPTLIEEAGDARQADMLANPGNYGGSMGTGISMTATCPNPRFGGGYYSDIDRGTDLWWYHGHCSTCGMVVSKQGASAEQQVKDACNSAHNYSRTIDGTYAIFPISNS